MDIYLESFGARLRLRDGVFEVTVPDLTGANHHVVEQFAAHEVENIFLHKGTSVSTDALLYALDEGRDILVLDSFGHPVGRLLSNRPTTTVQVWHNQLTLSQTVEGLRMARDWILRKLQFKINWLKKLKNYRDGDKAMWLDKAIATLRESHAALSRLVLDRSDNVAGTIRGIEGSASRLYWDTLSKLLPEEYRFDGRSRRPAQDPFNAFLNYAYGMLYTIVERALLTAGVHPYIGFFHSDDYQRKSMVFDFIEPYRVWADQCVFSLFASKKVLRAHVRPLKDGGLWLNEAGKAIKW